MATETERILEAIAGQGAGIHERLAGIEEVQREQGDKIARNTQNIALATQALTAHMDEHKDRMDVRWRFWAPLWGALATITIGALALLAWQIIRWYVGSVE